VLVHTNDSMITRSRLLCVGNAYDVTVVVVVRGTSSVVVVTGLSIVLLTAEVAMQFPQKMVSAVKMSVINPSEKEVNRLNWL
jgi:hypothetical protein